MSNARIRITASPHSEPGEVKAVEAGTVVWSGPIEDLADAWPFDALFCQDDDAERLARLLDSGKDASAPGG